MKRLAFLLPFFVAGCAVPDDVTPLLTNVQVEAVVSLAREKVLASGVANEAQEIEFVKNTRPGLSYYFLSRPYADYSVSWQVHAREFIVVYGRGNIFVLEGAHVERRSDSPFKPGT